MEREICTSRMISETIFYRKQKISVTLLWAAPRGMGRVVHSGGRVGLATKAEWSWCDTRGARVGVSTTGVQSWCKCNTRGRVKG